jgi:hypothetical protein
MSKKDVRKRAISVFFFRILTIRICLEFRDSDFGFQGLFRFHGPRHSPQLLEAKILQPSGLGIKWPIQRADAALAVI